MILLLQWYIFETNIAALSIYVNVMPNVISLNEFMRTETLKGCYGL